MFQLQVADTDVTNGTIAVSWCLDHEMLKDLAEEKLVDPQVVIVVAPVDNYHLNKEYRKVVPLKDLMTYIEFRAAGQNKIWGFISMRDGRKARSHYLDKNDGEFHTNVLNYDGDNYATNLRDGEENGYDENPQYKKLSQPISVVVPKASFAKEPPAWEKGWVNHLFKDKVVDQCEYRRRRMFAYGIQPFIMLGNLLLRSVIILFATLTLCRNISLQYLFHPLMYSLRDTFDVFEKGSLAVRHLPEDDTSSDNFPKPDYFLRSFYLAPLMPLIWAPVLYLLFKRHYVGLGIATGSLIIVGLIILAISFIANYSKAIKKYAKQAWAAMNDPGDNLWYLDQSEVEIITCSNEKKPLTFNTLPAKRKNVRLRFQNLKSKVCRPFSL